MYRENTLNAYAVGNAANGEGLGNSAVVLSDNSAFKHLYSFLLAFFDSHVYLNGASYKNFGCVFFEHICGKLFDYVHFLFLLK